MSDSTISLNKFISSTGICSRREADKWIDAGRVEINGVIARKGNRVAPEDKVTVDGKPVGEKPESVYIVFNKPPGITCTTDPRDRDNIIDFIRYPQRIFPIGRLDKASSGLILLTNNGDIVNKILRKENKHEKEYMVTVDRVITDRFVDRMSAGIPILGVRTLPCTVKALGRQKFKIILTQGLNRQIRRMCEYLDYNVLTLKRIRVMDIYLDGLKPGEWKELTGQERDEIEALL